MTDNEIIKGLDVLKSWQKLAYHNDDGTDEDSHELYEALTIVFDLINRQKAEIEALIKGQETLQNHIAEQKAEIERLENSLAMSKRETKIALSSIKGYQDKAIKECVFKIKDQIKNNSAISAEWLREYLDKILEEVERESGRIDN